MQTNLPTYPHYKPSGVQWLGDIPEHWEVKRFMNSFNLGKGLTITKENLKEEGVLCVNYGEIHSKYAFVLNPDVHKLKCVDFEYLKKSPNSLLNNGDFVFADTSEDIEGSGNFTHLESNESVFAGYHTIIARPIANFLPKFVAYELDSLSFRSQIRSKVKGVKVYSITQSILNELKIWLPPLPEQTAIATFLDRKTALIDKAISLKEKQIELLKERRQILIHQAVTRGLNPDVPMKDSGVEWIGEIPEHWEVKKIKHLVNKSFSGGTPSTDKLDFWDGGISWVSSGDVKMEFLLETTREISIKGLQRSSSNLAPKGSIIFVTRSGILQHTFAISILGKEMAINQDIKCLILKNNTSSEYFQKFIKGNNAQILVEVRQQAATVESINMEAFFNIQIPIPPPSEQQKIVSYLDDVSKKIDKAIGLKEQEIEKLKEYKASLINSVVTGKVKVTAPPEE